MHGYWILIDHTSVVINEAMCRVQGATNPELSAGHAWGLLSAQFRPGGPGLFAERPWNSTKLHVLLYTMSLLCLDELCTVL